MMITRPNLRPWLASIRGGEVVGGKAKPCHDDGQSVAWWPA